MKKTFVSFQSDEVKETKAPREFQWKEKLRKLKYLSTFLKKSSMIKKFTVNISKCVLKGLWNKKKGYIKKRNLGKINSLKRVQLYKKIIRFGKDPKSVQTNPIKIIFNRYCKIRRKKKTFLENTGKFLFFIFI